MQSQRTVGQRREGEQQENVLGATPVLLPPTTVTVPAEATQALHDQLELHRYALGGVRTTPEERQREVTFNSRIATLATRRNNETGRMEIDPSYHEFVSGKLQFLTVFVPPDDRSKKRALDTLRSLITSIEEQGSIPHYLIIEDPNNPSIVTVVNNWFIPFSEADRQKLSDILEQAESKDANTMAQALYVYTNLLELGKKIYALNVSKTLFSAIAGEQIGQLLSSYKQLYSTALDALSSIVNGDADATDLLQSTSALATFAEENYGNVFYQIVYAIERLPVFTPSLWDFTSHMVNSNPQFSDVEKQIFNSLQEAYNSMVEEIRGKSYEIAAYILGVPPGSTLHPAGSLPIQIEGLTPSDISLFQKFCTICSQLQLFTAKAKFLEIALEYEPYETFSDNIRPDAGFLTEDAIGGEAQGRSDSSSLFQFISSEEREKHSRELREIGEQLLTYGEMIEDIMMNTSSLTQFFNAEEMESFFSEPRNMRENFRRNSRLYTRDLETMMEFGRKYLSELNSSLNNMLETAAENQINLDLQTRFREGGFWDKVYAFSNYFLREAGTEFLVLSTLLSTAIGGVAGLAVGTGVRATATASARAGFAAAATLTAGSASIVFADALSHVGEEGIAGQRAEEDIRLATQFLMCGGMAWAGGTGMVSRLFSTTAFGAGTGGAGVNVSRDIERGDWVSAIADAVVYGAGAYMFIRGLNGIQRIQLSQPIPDGTIRVGSLFGLQSVQLPNVAEWVTFPYTARGLSTFYLGAAILDPIFDPDGFAVALEREGFDGLRRRWNEMYARYAYTVPAFNLVLGSLGEARRAVRGAMRQRAATRLINTLQIPTANPSRTAFAITMRAGERAILMAKELGMNVEDRVVLRHLYTLTLRDTNASMTVDDIAAEVRNLLRDYCPPQATDEAFNNFARNLSTMIKDIWDNAALMEGTTTTLTEEQINNRLRNLTNLASNARQQLIRYGLGSLVVGGIAYLRVREPLSYHHELRTAQQNYRPMLDELTSDLRNRWFVDSVLLQGQFPGFFGEGKERELIESINNRMGLVANSAFIMFGRIKREGTSSSYWRRELLNLIPEEQKRFELVYAASLALLQNGISDRREYLEQLGGFLDNIALFMNSQPQMAWGEMEMSDFFILCNYLLHINEANPLRVAKRRLASLISNLYINPPNIENFTSSEDIDNIISSPEFARIALALLHQAAVLGKPEDWANNMIIDLFSMASWDPAYFSAYRGEILAEAFGQMASSENMSYFDFLFLISTLSSSRADSKYPLNIYFPEETSREE